MQAASKISEFMQTHDLLFPNYAKTTFWKIEFHQDFILQMMELSKIWENIFSQMVTVAIEAFFKKHNISKSWILILTKIYSIKEFNFF